MLVNFNKRTKSSCNNSWTTGLYRDDIFLLEVFSENPTHKFNFLVIAVTARGVLLFVSSRSFSIVS